MMLPSDPSDGVIRKRRPRDFFNRRPKSGTLTEDRPPMPGRRVPECPERFRKPLKPPGVKSGGTIVG